MIPQVINHLWQSTVFAIFAAILAAGFRRNRAAVRFWCWFAASVKFLLPFSLLISLGKHLDWAPAARTLAGHVAAPAVTFTWEPGTWSSSAHGAFVSPGFSGSFWLPLAMLCLWAGGLLAVAWIRLHGWTRIRAVVRNSVPVTIPGAEITTRLQVRVSEGLLEPGIVGWWHPILLMPTGLTAHLTRSQLTAVLAHELCHVRRRDNLLASLHMMVEAVFWFHPMVWWIGARLVEEREHACDEEVLRVVAEPREYAMGILNVCKLCVQSPLACVSGITGADLQRRMEAIMANRPGQKLNRTTRFLLALAAAAVLAAPVMIGIGDAPAVKAQALPAQQFDVASIKPNTSGTNTLNIRIAPGGRLTAANATLGSLIAAAYQIKPFQLSGGPAWLDSAKYDIEAKGQLKPGIKTGDQINGMLQALLADRFQLKMHEETKTLPVYALLVAKNGPKLEASGDAACFDPTAGLPPPLEELAAGRIRPCGGFNGAPGQLLGARVTMRHLASTLTNILGRTVVSKTGLGENYDIALKWVPNEIPASLLQDSATPAAADDSGPSIFTALREQLGLRLESQKGPVEILVIDHAERPSEN